MKMQGYNGSQCWDTTFAVQVRVSCLFCVCGGVVGKCAVLVIPVIPVCLRPRLHCAAGGWSPC